MSFIYKIVKWILKYLLLTLSHSSANVQSATRPQVVCKVTFRFFIVIVFGLITIKRRNLQILLSVSHVEIVYRILNLDYNKIIYWFQVCNDPSCFTIKNMYNIIQVTNFVTNFHVCLCLQLGY